MYNVKIDGFLCERCSHRRIVRQPGLPGPKVCPKCHSGYWDKPKMSLPKGNPAWRERSLTGQPAS